MTFVEVMKLIIPSVGTLLIGLLLYRIKNLDDKVSREEYKDTLNEYRTAMKELAERVQYLERKDCANHCPVYDKVMRDKK